MTDVTKVKTIDRYEDCHLLVNFQTRAVVLDGQTLDLTRKEFDLLAFLVRRAGELVTRTVLLTVVWGYKAEIRTRTVDVHIRHLRQSLGLYGKHYIETIFGKGYRFQAMVAGNDKPTVGVTTKSSELSRKDDRRHERPSVGRFLLHSAVRLPNTQIAP